MSRDGVLVFTIKADADRTRLHNAIFIFSKVEKKPPMERNFEKYADKIAINC